MLCPICQREVAEPRPGERGFLPFCSERCKLIDLGRWLGGKYQIPVVDSDEAHDGVVETEPQTQPQTEPQEDRRGKRERRRR
jgi:endogenous inhibitor of DNA gyrase (YacG/DUF329 family)